ncbi:MAG: mechanosensitive ion channel protein MscS [Acidobacteria bacterium]|jgi:small conductance mechanosensitive channel|nr:mechanosensitive ion channel protein MscS [Acidobacteriota bacterium]
MFLQNSNTSTENSNGSTGILNSAWTIKDATWDSINNILTSIIERLPYVVAGLLVLLIFWLLARLVKSIFWKASHRTKLDNRLRILFSRLIVVFIFIVGIFTALTVIIPTFQFGDLVTGLGFTSFVIGFATKDILNNLLSGVLILWQQPFRIGDYIYVGNNQGKVEYIGVRATQLRKDDGELVLIPNGDMYSSPLTIRGAGAERRMLLKINIGYDSDIKQAKKIIDSVLRSAEGVIHEPKSNAVVTDLTGDGVNISIYFWINTDKNPPMQVFDTVATEIKTSLCGAGIEMFPPSAVILQTPESEALPVDNTSAQVLRRGNDWG